LPTVSPTADSTFSSRPLSHTAPVAVRSHPANSAGLPHGDRSSRAAPRLRNGLSRFGGLDSVGGASAGSIALRPPFKINQSFTQPQRRPTESFGDSRHRTTTPGWSSAVTDPQRPHALKRRTEGQTYTVRIAGRGRHLRLPALPCQLCRAGGLRRRTPSPSTRPLSSEVVMPCRKLFSFCHCGGELRIVVEIRTLIVVCPDCGNRKPACDDSAHPLLAPRTKEPRQPQDPSLAG
jgi:hypothetical protein